MTEGVYHFQVGSMACMIVHEGRSEIPIASLQERYPNATPEQLQDALHTLSIQGEAIESHMNCLIVEHHGKRLLVDTGQGAAAQPRLGNLLPRMQAAGITPEMIDQVFITHFHIDHINGLIDAEDKPIFPNADYSTQRGEWEYWFSAETQARIGEERAGLIQRQLLPLEDRFRLLDDGDEILPGIHAMLIPGHSPAHCGLVLESDGERLLHVVDLLHHAAQLLYPEWHIKFDYDRAQAEATRKKILAKAADENLLTMFYHLPFPAVGRVLREGRAFRWQQQPS